MCIIDKCDRAQVARGLCRKHYDRVRRGWDHTKVEEPKVRLACAFETCFRAARTNKLCNGHYQQQRKGNELTAFGTTYGDKRRIGDADAHGRPSTYSNWGCRCELCSIGWAAYNQGLKARRQATTDLNNIEHGSTSSYYNLGCRCKSCKNAGTRSIGSKKGFNYHDEYSKRGGVCDCCDKRFPKLVFDHDHITGKHRGYLCQGCNTGLGKMGDSIEGLERALEYLTKAANN